MHYQIWRSHTQKIPNTHMLIKEILSGKKNYTFSLLWGICYTNSSWGIHFIMLDPCKSQELHHLAYTWIYYQYFASPQKSTRKLWFHNNLHHIKIDPIATLIQISHQLQFEANFPQDNTSHLNNISSYEIQPWACLSLILQCSTTM